MTERIYKVSDLKRLIKESSNEFKPTMGKGVEKEDKENNEKAYKEASKRAKDFDGGLDNKKKTLGQYPNTFNKGMQDIFYDGQVPEQFKKNVLAQMKGYTSAQNEELHEDDETPVEHNEIPKMKERTQQFKANRDQNTLLGLTGSQMNKSDVKKIRHTVFEEGKVPRYKYKRTIFLNEEHMLGMMPDECKVEGYKCIMEDAKGCEVYVTWHDEEPDVYQKTKINESMAKAKNMMNFSHKTLHTTNQVRVNEDKMVENMMNKVRELMK